jgi:hypothetical protein
MSKFFFKGFFNTIESQGKVGILSMCSKKLMENERTQQTFTPCT